MKVDSSVVPETFQGPSIRGVERKFVERVPFLLLLRLLGQD